jgi:hypothetical protein
MVLEWISARSEYFGMKLTILHNVEIRQRTHAAGGSLHKIMTKRTFLELEPILGSIPIGVE